MSYFGRPAFGLWGVRTLGKATGVSAGAFSDA